MKKITIPLIFLIIVSIVFIFSLTNIVLWFIDNQNTSSKIKLIKEITPIEKVNETNKQNDYIAVDFTNLKKVNNETIAWIQVPNTKIDYPVVQHKDNSYYLSHSFDKTKNNAGWVFLDYRNSIEEMSDNTIIYAHGRLDKTMFGSLRDLTTTEYLEKEEHLIYLSTPSQNYVYEIFSIYHIVTTDDYITTSFPETEFSNWLNTMEKRSIYNFNIDVDSSEKILTLSTCYNNNEKLVVHSRLVRKQSRY